MPYPSYGAMSCEIFVLIGAVLVMPGVAGFVLRISHAGPTWVRPFPCSYAP